MRKITSRLSVCLSARIEQFAPTGRIFMKFDICAYWMEKKPLYLERISHNHIAGVKINHNFNIQKPTVSIWI